MKDNPFYWTIIISILLLFLLAIMRATVYIGLLIYVFLLIILIYWLMVFETAEMTIRIDIHPKLIADIFLSILSFILFVAVLFEISDVIQTFLAAFIVLLFPGYVVLRLLGYSSLYSWIEWIPFSFALSLVLSTLMIFPLSIIPFTGILFSLCQVVLSIFLLITSTKEIFKARRKHSDKYLFNFCDSSIAVFSWITSCFLFVIFSLYPSMVHVTGLDVGRIFSKAALVLYNPTAYQSHYPFFTYSLAAIIALSSAAYDLVLSFTSLYSIIAVFAFYIVSRILAERNNSQGYLLATLAFFFFSGFGWISFLMLGSITNGIVTKFILITYWDIGSGVGTWLWLWFRPWTAGVSIFFVLVHMLLRFDISQKKYIALFASILFSLFNVHLPEAILLSAVLLGLAVLFPNRNQLRLRDSTLAIIMAQLLYLGYSLFAGLQHMYSGSMVAIIHILIFGSAILTLLFSYLNLSCYLSKAWNYLFENRQIVSSLASVSFIGFLIAWIMGLQRFSSKIFITSLYTPLLFYPIISGIIGLIAIFSIHFLGHDILNSRAKIAIVLLVVIFAVGKIISAFNIMVYNVGYGERRYFPLIYAFLCVLSMPSLKSVSKYLRNIQRIKSLSIITLLTMTAVLSSFQTIGFWQVKSRGGISEDERFMIDYLSSSQNRPLDSSILSLSDETRAYLEYVPASHIFNRYRIPIWTSQYPSVPLTIAWSEYSAPMYIYLDYQSSLYLWNDYRNSFFSNNLISASNAVSFKYNSSLFALPEASPPSLDGEIALVLDEEYGIAASTIIEALGFNDWEYTLCHIDDSSTILESSTIIFSYDGHDTKEVLEFLIKSKLNELTGKRIIVMNSNGFGPISTSFFERTDDSFIAENLMLEGTTIPLSQSLNVPFLKTRSNIITIADYVGEERTSPFVVVNNDVSLNLAYMNIWPMIVAGSKLLAKKNSSTILNYQGLQMEPGVVADESLSGNDGEAVGVSSVPSIVGSSFYFDSGGHIIVNNSASLNPRDKLAIEVWLYPFNAGEGFSIFNKKESYASTSGYMFLYDGVGFYFNIGTGEAYYPNQLVYRGLESNTTHQIVLVFDGELVSYYLNGRKIGEIECSVTIQSNLLNPFIGMRRNGHWPFGGILDYIEIFNRSLSSDEISERYHSMISRETKNSHQSRILGRVLKIINPMSAFNSENSNWIWDAVTAFFSECKFSGRTTMEFLSYVKLELGKTNGISLISELGLPIHTEVKEITISPPRPMLLSFDELNYLGGEGFYSHLFNSTPHPFDLEPGSIIRILTTDSIKYLQINSTIRLSPSDVSKIIVRNPITIRNEGISLFETMFTLRGLYRTIGLNGERLQTQGKTNLSIKLSDKYSFITEFEYSSAVTEKGQSELDALYNYIVIYAPIFLIAGIFTFFYWCYKKRRKAEE